MSVFGSYLKSGGEFGRNRIRLFLAAAVQNAKRVAGIYLLSNFHFICETDSVIDLVIGLQPAAADVLRRRLPRSCSLKARWHTTRLETALARAS